MIDPRGMSVVEWSDAMSFSLNRYGHAPRLDNPDDWRDYAIHLNNLPFVAQRNPPNPFGFENWAEWAERFNLVADLGD